MKKVSLTQYLVVLIITLALFIIALVSSNYANQKKTDELKTMEDKISVDILSLETQFDLVKQSSCSTYDESPIQQQLASLSSRLSFMEQQLGTDNPDVVRLKQYYYILEIQDYLLNKKMADECKRPAVFILYFYSSKNCDNCLAQNYMLQAAKDAYPQVTEYSFDYNAINLPALQTLTSLHNIPQNPPILDINGRVFAGFDSYDSLKLQIDAALASSTATTTQPASAAKKAAPRKK